MSDHSPDPEPGVEPVPVCASCGTGLDRDGPYIGDDTRRLCLKCWLREQDLNNADIFDFTTQIGG